MSKIRGPPVPQKPSADVLLNYVRIRRRKSTCHKVASSGNLYQVPSFFADTAPLAVSAKIACWRKHPQSPLRPSSMVAAHNLKILKPLLCIECTHTHKSFADIPKCSIRHNIQEALPTRYLESNYRQWLWSPVYPSSDPIQRFWI